MSPHLCSDRQMSSLYEYIAIALIGLVVLAALLFFTAFPGHRFIRVHAYLRSLRKELEPVARAVGASTKTEWAADKEQVMYFFEFPNEKWTISLPGAKDHVVNAWLTLEVGERGFNLYIPSFSPTKHTLLTMRPWSVQSTGCKRKIRPNPSTRGPALAGRGRPLISKVKPKDRA